MRQTEKKAIHKLSHIVKNENEPVIQKDHLLNSPSSSQHTIKSSTIMISLAVVKSFTPFNLTPGSSDNRLDPQNERHTESCYSGLAF